MAKPIFFDIDDAISTTFPEVRIKIGASEHVMQEATVQTFIDNTKDMMALQEAQDNLEEIEILTRLIIRAFPTTTPKEIHGLTISQLHKLVNFFRSVSGEIDQSDVTEEDVAQGKPLAED